MNPYIIYYSYYANNMNIGYIKYNCYIITIEIYSNKHNSIFLPINNELYAYYITNLFKVIKIEKISSTEEINKIYFKRTLIEIDNIYNFDVYYHINYKVAFDFNFIEHKQYLLFENGYSGYYKIYTFHGKPILEYFHINGIKEGIEQIYDIDGVLTRTIEWVNGKKHGYEITYTNNKRKDSKLYINGELQLH